ncbi:unnamed protein product [Mytilus coruscus]|uniref:Uncharacterized protein n=1 Tax=Mytilus coruscus TaxID=42192 RepID=A0A6J8AJK0_MYTCO|nr:unnamed protein product [Mytilus coruscus]
MDHSLLNMNMIQRKLKCLKTHSVSDDNNTIPPDLKRISSSGVNIGQKGEQKATAVAKPFWNTESTTKKKIPKSTPEKKEQQISSSTDALQQKAQKLFTEKLLSEPRWWVMVMNGPSDRFVILYERHKTADLNHLKAIDEILTKYSVLQIVETILTTNTHYKGW